MVMSAFVIDVEYDSNNFVSEVSAHKIINPLVAAIVIGDYSCSTLPNIRTTNEDYNNIIDAFSITHNYTVVVAQHIKNNGDFSLKQFHSGITVTQNGNFKSKWNSEEIEDFNLRIKTDYIENDNTYFDSLIYIVSCHGNGEDLIYDSNGEEFSLSYIYNEFDNQNCRNLRNKPKICLFDIYKIDSINNDANYNDKNNGIHEQEEKLEESTSDVVVTKPKTKPQHSGKAISTTYTKDTHYRRIFCNSGHQPILKEKIDWRNKCLKNGSIFIQCFCHVFKHSVNENITDILVKTRKRMATVLHLPPKDGVDTIVLSDDKTMPYEIELGSEMNHDTNLNEHVQQTKVCV